MSLNPYTELIFLLRLIQSKNGHNYGADLHGLCLLESGDTMLISDHSRGVLWFVRYVTSSM